MLALLLWCAVVLGTDVKAAYVTRNDAGAVPTVANGTLSSFTSNRTILVEEVDKHGNSIVKELELADYDEGEEKRDDDRKKNEPQDRKQRSDKLTDIKRRDLYGCDKRRESQQRKCLKRQKKFLKTRYKNWNALFRRIIKDLDGKIKTMGHVGGKESRAENTNSLSGLLTSKNVMRNKE